MICLCGGRELLPQGHAGGTSRPGGALRVLGVAL